MRDRTPFARLVLEERTKRSMTQAALAGACGVTERTIIRAEAGKSLSQETVMALRSVLGLPAARMTQAPVSPLRIVETPAAGSVADTGTPSKSRCFDTELVVCFPPLLDEEALDFRRKTVREIAGRDFGGIVTSPDYEHPDFEENLHGIPQVTPNPPEPMTFKERLDMALLGPTGSQRMLVVTLIAATIAGGTYGLAIHATEAYQIALGMGALIAVVAAVAAYVANFDARKPDPTECTTLADTPRKEFRAVYHMIGKSIFRHDDSPFGQWISDTGTESMTIETTETHVHCRFVSSEGDAREIRFLPNQPPILEALRGMRRSIHERQARADAFMESYAA